ncbi:MAG: sporulation protein YqfD [Lachnospiraceae bacterium]|nr:sporulation protein YqfD [Lachnospiraceae bacterium]
MFTGDEKIRFVNLCRNNNLKIWKLYNDENTIVMNCDKKDFKKMKPLRRKCHGTLRIQKRTGLYFKAVRQKAHTCFLVGILLFLLMGKLLSLFIWNISFDGNYSYTNVELMRFLNSKHVNNGLLKSDIDCDKIEYLLRTNYSDITWVSAEIKGTKLIIHIKENFDGYIAKNETRPYDIVSGTHGVITKIITRSGVPQVKAGDEITEGQLLVSGIVDTYGDNETFISRKFVQADADIYADEVLEYKDEFELIHPNKKYTGEKNNIYTVSILGKKIYLSLFQKKFKLSDVVTTDKQLSITDNYYLPLSTGKITVREYITDEAVYSEEEASQIAENNLEIFIKNLQEKGIQIIEKNVTIACDEKFCHASGTIKVNRQIGDVQYIDEEKNKIEIPQTGENNDSDE